MNKRNLWVITWAAVVLMLMLSMRFSLAYTNDQDVYAINNLYSALGSPPLPGWVPNGGDPCTESWQGVQCIGSNITAIILNGANLGGDLGDKLQNFTSIVTIDLSNNNIGGSIPENLPYTMSKFFLAANQLTGSIPKSLAQLTLLSDMSVNENHLTGELPDAFQSLTGLINLDLSSNNLSGQLPPSMGSLSSITTLHIQNNQLSGTLDVLQDLPLKDLNIENNLFSGPIPEKLLNIPNFKNGGNPFNTSIAPSPPTLSSPPLSPPGASAPETMPKNSSDGPADQNGSPPRKNKKVSALKVIGFVVLAVCVVIVAVLMVMYCMSKYQDRKFKHEAIPKGREERIHERPKDPKIYQERNLIGEERIHERPKDPKIYQERNVMVEKIPKGEKEKVQERSKHPINHGNLIEPNRKMEKAPPEAAVSLNRDHEIDIAGTEMLELPPLPEKVIVNRRVPAESIPKAPSLDLLPPTSVTSFSVASLQQYTGSFREENVISDGRFGKTYLAELPDRKLLAVLKLDNANLNMPVDDFLELVLAISELRHPNITELVGYCAEFGQRLLVYNYFSKRSLHDVLHGGDDLKRKLSWDARIKIALQSAKVLEYLHEACQPPVIHQNFEPANVLLDDKLAVHVSECGMASLVSSNSVTQLSGRIRSLFSYEAPELNESGSFTDRSDVYSFGVVMLELLTGRLPYDSSLPRPEQHLVRWASSQLHDINALSRMVDPSIDKKYPIKSLSRFADIISRCIQSGPEFRPLMSEVVQDLKLVVEESRNRSIGEDPMGQASSFKDEDGQ
ncbi:Non-specific protein-tyrosine kinase protein [Dioscorea alata]|uniref:Non-specific protein-tyrosine kinase protein n=3 Tax=Dioscorea alata TaxID=55571 RepID=A0ACB7U3E3_DIOAL|nr:Non-specific protein-tyrosine kinase protein [Dioscorea alata]KAH7654795.1 Non-specific protein-tyrosine kinase protein [Dioscorea alata]KAH7654796.1 Non-specific protein-tyrosine kinase protein [Dioscorea alata]